jgi:hypothetical protein
MVLEVLIKIVFSSTRKAYDSPPEAYKEYKAAAAKWYEQLSPEARKALKKFRMRKTGSGYTLYVFCLFHLLF